MNASLILLLLSLFEVRSDPQCVDETGSPVDWFVVYKMPKDPEKEGTNEQSFIDEGLGYFMFDSHSNSKGWRLSEKAIEDPKSLVGRTLEPIYDKKASDLFYMMYNDEHPDGNTSFTDGHTKGVVFFGEKTGVWLVHSVPKFPPNVGDGYGYPHSGRRYGQSFLCISLRTSDSADLIGLQMLYNKPYIYQKNVPKFASSHYPNLVLASEGKHLKKEPYFHIVPLKTSINSVPMISFAKHTAFNDDLYSDLVAPVLNVDLGVETWPNGHGRMPSNCTLKNKVENVKEVYFKKFGEKLDFRTQHDHAKWGVSLTSARPFVCIGDINRMESQKKRAGGTVCFSDKFAWKNFDNIIESIEKC